MERKIGEIFEYKGEWYQCLKSKEACSGCIAFGKNYSFCRSFGECTGDTIFKKLEKVGKPYEKRVSDGSFSTFQRFRVYNSVILPKEPYIYCNFIDGTIEIEIKQNKGDMEEKKSNLKPFNLELAKQGKPVCTRDGRKARIVCFDAKGDKPIIALIEMGVAETPNNYPIDGKAISTKETPCDLMMLPEKKEGWINVYALNTCYSSKEEAEANIDRDYEHEYVRTVKIEWEE